MGWRAQGGVGESAASGCWPVPTPHLQLRGTTHSTVSPHPMHITPSAAATQRGMAARARAAAGVGDQDVLRLQVAVDDARVAQHAQRVQHLAQQPLQQAQRQAAEAVALQQLKQVGAQPLKDQAQVVAVVAVGGWVGGVWWVMGVQRVAGVVGEYCWWWALAGLGDGGERSCMGEGTGEAPSSCPEHTRAKAPPPHPTHTTRRARTGGRSSRTAAPGGARRPRRTRC